MFCPARTDDSIWIRKSSALRDARRTSLAGEPADRNRLDAKRREVQALLDEIRDTRPQPADILHVVQEVVQDATGGALNRERLGRIEAGIRALYAAD